jgi:hypothetical protein
VRVKVVFGDREEVLRLLGRSTSYIERNNLTSRLGRGRQARKTLAFSKDLEMYRASVVWEDAYYNLVRPHKGLGVCDDKAEGGYRFMTPAMAALFDGSSLVCQRAIDGFAVAKY